MDQKNPMLTAKVIDQFLGTVNGQWIEMIAGKLADCGFPPEPLRIHPDRASSSKTSYKPVGVDFVRYCHRQAIQLTGNVLFPVDLALALQPLDLKALGVVMWSCTTLRQRLQKLLEYQSVLTTATHLFYSESPENGCLFFLDSNPVDEKVNLTSLGVMALLAAVVTILHWELAYPVRLSVTVPEAEQDFGNRLQQRFGCGVNYSVHKFSISFALEDLNCPIKSRDTDLLQANERLVKQSQALYQKDNIVQQISRMLLHISLSSPPSVEEVAAHLRMSRRTFQRKLTECGLCYRDIVMKTRLERAMAMLESSSRPSYTQIAYELGFAELSSFSRAFKQWTGRSPSEYRANRQTELAEHL